MAVLAPMPRASVSTTTVVKPRDLASIRNPLRTSCQNVCITTLQDSLSREQLARRNASLLSLLGLGGYQRLDSSCLPELSDHGKGASRKRTAHGQSHAYRQPLRLLAISLREPGHTRIAGVFRKELIVLGFRLFHAATFSSRYSWCRPPRTECPTTC